MGRHRIVPVRKRVEKGRFAHLWGEDTLELTMAELQLFLEGSALVGKVRVSPAALCLKCLTKATGSHSKRGAEVAAVMYTLSESAKLAGADPHAYVLEATRRAIASPGTATLPEDVT